MEAMQQAVQTVETVRAARVAVELNTRDYVRSHGQNPRGRGYWNFCTVFPGSAGYLDRLVTFTGSYAECARAARLHAQLNGLTVLYVCA